MSKLAEIGLKEDFVGYDLVSLKDSVKKTLLELEEYEKDEQEYEKAKKQFEDLKEKHELGLKGLEAVLSQSMPIHITIENKRNENLTKVEKVEKVEKEVNETKEGLVKLKSMDAYVSKKYYNENSPVYFKEQLVGLGYTCWKQAPKYVICKAMMPIFNEMKKCTSTEYMKLYKEARFNCLPNSNIFKVFGNWAKMIKYLGIEVIEVIDVIDVVKEAPNKEKSSVGMHLVYSELILEDSQLKEIAEKGVNFKVWENKLTKKEILSLVVYCIKKTGYVGETAYKLNYKTLGLRLPSVSCILNIFGNWDNVLNEIGIEIGNGNGNGNGN